MSVREWETERAQAKRARDKIEIERANKQASKQTRRMRNAEIPNNANKQKKNVA